MAPPSQVEPSRGIHAGIESSSAMAYREEPGGYRSPDLRLLYTAPGQARAGQHPLL